MQSHAPTALQSTASEAQRAAHYADLLAELLAILEDEDDWTSAMATVSCVLHQALDYAHWTGFYRNPDDKELRVGPYQGGMGCLRIDFQRGVCGAAARTRQSQLVPHVHDFPGHIACSSSTLSELVVPVLTPGGQLLAVLDVDSDEPAAFTRADQVGLEQICRALGERYQGTRQR